MTDQMNEYRQHLVLAEQKSVEQYDRTILSLSGGALGVSFAFLDNVVGEGPLQCPALLYVSWFAWGASVFCVLASFYVSHRSLRRAIHEVDEGRVHQGRPGGWLARFTDVFNVLGGILFVLGVVLIALFVRENLGA